jgi:uncharacterized membrane protein
MSQTDTVFTQDGSGNYDRAVLKEHAKNVLKGKWNFCALVLLVFFVITGVISSIPRIGGLIIFVISGPMNLGLSFFFLNLIRNKPVEMEQLFSGFKDFIRVFTAYLLMVIFVALWMLLLVIPGIVAALSYSMIFYLLADNPDLSAMDAIRKSKELMKGHKGELFMLLLSFTGWFLLSLLTLGIGLLWLAPYVNTSMALFYQRLAQANATESGRGLSR